MVIQPFNILGYIDSIYSKIIEVNPDPVPPQIEWVNMIAWGLSDY